MAGPKIKQTATTVARPLVARARAFRPDSLALYLVDNGACLCGAHLGATASATGRDLSGQAILKLTPAMVAAEGMALSDFACERRTCGRTLVISGAA